jgi:hypothetical protein
MNRHAITVQVTEIIASGEWPQSWAVWLGAPLALVRVGDEVELRLVGVPDPTRRFADVPSALRWIGERIARFEAQAERMGGDETTSGRYYRDHAYRLFALARAIVAYAGNGVGA